MNKIGYLFLFCCLIFVDQVSKYWIIAQKLLYDNGSFFRIHLSYNRGISLGLFHSDSSFYFGLLSVAIAATLFAFSWYAYQMYREGYKVLAYVFVLAGAVSNFIDRLNHGSVIDFIAFYWGGFNFPIFNIADCYIFLGVAYILCFQYQDSCNVFSKK